MIRLLFLVTLLSALGTVDLSEFMEGIASLEIAPDKRGIHKIILFLYKNISCGYSLEALHCASNEYPQHRFL